LICGRPFEVIDRRNQPQLASDISQSPRRSILRPLTAASIWQVLEGTGFRFESLQSLEDYSSHRRGETGAHFADVPERADLVIADKDRIEVFGRPECIRRSGTYVFGGRTFAHPSACRSRTALAPLGDDAFEAFFPDRIGR
jgi:hypothetical protein